MTKTQTEKEEALESLRGWVKPGDKVYTILRHVSASGMTRHIGLVVGLEGNMIHPNWAAAKAMGWRLNKRGDGLVVGGCGMDMGFHLVYTLGRVLWPNGFDCVGEACRSNDHSNGDRDRTPHHHNDSGYALQQSWL